jgi:sulfatase modifying factor 1
MSYAPGVSPFGIFNMAGNVWEWCADWYDPGRYGYPSDEDPPSALERGALPFGDRNYPNPAHKDIRDARVGPPVGAERVIRGGSFTDPIQRCRVDSRAAALPGVHQNNIGFRCVLLLPPDKEETTAVASR